MAETPPIRRPDESMELLNSILRDSVDPAYRRVSRAEPAPRAWHAWLSLIACLIAGFMITVSSIHNSTASPALADERAALIRRIEDETRASGQLRTEVGLLQEEIQQLGESKVGSDPSVAAREQALSMAAGTVSVTGPGLLITITDAPQAGSKGMVIDQDLRQVVNGLWSSGAEAIAINGHRITSRTAIRQAGSAITVNYRSLSAPYRIEAIGDQRDLPARFSSSAGGVWLNYLKNNFGIGNQLQPTRSLRLAADQTLSLNEAQPVR